MTLRMYQHVRCNAGPFRPQGWLVWKDMDFHVLTAIDGILPPLLADDDGLWFELPVMIVTKDHFEDIFERHRIGFTNCRPSVFGPARIGKVS